MVLLRRAGLARLATGILVAATQIAGASPFEPHPLPDSGPWFEGWFTRITDPQQGASATVILGAFQSRASVQFTSLWVAMLVSHPNATMHTEQVFLDPTTIAIRDWGSPVREQPPRTRQANFSIVCSAGQLVVNGTQSHLDFQMPSGLSLQADLDSRVPWDASCPDACGPEGWAGHLPGWLVPTHYAVHTLASKVNYQLNGQPGTGFAHQESNYGAHFPAAWVWMQGISADGRRQLVVTGGEFDIAGVTLPSYIVAFRSDSRDWDFRSIDMDRVEAKVFACNATVRLFAHSRQGGRRLELLITAPHDSFSDPLYVPSSSGFGNKPGSVESFAAVATVRLFEKVGGDTKLVETSRIPQMALEFGGKYRCVTSGPFSEALRSNSLTFV